MTVRGLGVWLRWRSACLAGRKLWAGSLVQHKLGGAAKPVISTLVKQRLAHQKLKFIHIILGDIACSRPAWAT